VWIVWAPARRKRGGAEPRVANGLYLLAPRWCSCSGSQVWSALVLISESPSERKRSATEVNSSGWTSTESTPAQRT